MHAGLLSSKIQNGNKCCIFENAKKSVPVNRRHYYLYVSAQALYSEY